MRIIPAIDIINGQCVRLTKGHYSSKKIYDYKPLEMAKRFEDVGLNYLHLVDLDGAKSTRIVNFNILEQIASKTNLQIDFGGGLKSDEDVRIAFECGASQVNIGSIAVKNPELFLNWLKTYGSDKILLSADCHNGKIMADAWQNRSNFDIIDFILYYQQRGNEKVVCTDVSKDGMLSGPSLELYREIIQKTNVQLVASGGISKIQDLEDLREIACEGAIIGKAIYEGKISLKELEKLC